MADGSDGLSSYNRYSMPVTRSRTGFYNPTSDLDQTGTTRFLFGEDEAVGDSKYGQANLDDHFPTLIRREDHMSLSTINTSQLNSNSGNEVGSIGSSRPSSVRHSLDLKYQPSEAIPVVSPTSNSIMATPPKLQSSFSANDVPTVKNAAGANNHAQQHFHNHNASIGRIPAGAVPTRHSREMSNDSNMGNREQSGNFHSIQSALHGNAAPFGPAPLVAQNPIHTSQPGSAAPANPAITAPGGMNGYGFYGSGAPGNNYQTHVPATSGPPLAGGFNVNMLAMGLQNMTMNNGGGGPGPAYNPQNFTGFGNLYQANQGAPPRDSQARVIQHRRQLDQEAMQRYHNLPLERVGGQIYDLCKDQHGCRYLQKQLEERNPENVHMIWLETNAHVIELMTDPFGNYLCQKLLEFCNDEERTVLIQNAAQDMVRIALNQHGTRALQKMIEFVSTPVQVQMIIDALRYRVVDLIQDLNGNHVIQKCLNKLSAQDAQFIFDAVGNHCVDVGTHRHGCCVLQRCIDHADGDQKIWLIGKITDHAPVLVQDPFGNYVVQYIIDLNEPTFTEPVVAMFRNKISQLSRHKFSSNVIEKCLRCSMEPSRDMIVDELLAHGEIERILRDNYANYVVQTALEYASPHGKYRLVEAIRPHLPNIRSTPYGRRIQAKIQAYDGRGSASSSGQITPADNTGGQIPLRPGRNHGMVNNTSILSNGGGVPNSYSANMNGGGGGARSNNNGLNYPLSANISIPVGENGASVPGAVQGTVHHLGGWAGQPEPQQTQTQPGVNGEQAQPNSTEHAQWL